MTNDKAEVLKGRITELVAKLADSTDQAAQSQLFSAYLKMCATLHHYSWHNCALIFSQCPHATRVAGYVRWKELGRQVVAGAKGIAIFVPMTRKEKVTAEDGAEQESTRLWFAVRYVFDVSATMGEPLPELPTDCTGDGGEILCARLMAYAAGLGITVETKPIEGSAKGYAWDKGRKIVLSDALAPADRAAVLIHEVTHCLAHFGDPKPNLKQRELEAEATSFVVASHFGLNPESRWYLASYQITATDLLDSLETIQTTAAQVINALEAKPEDSLAYVA